MTLLFLDRLKPLLTREGRQAMQDERNEFDELRIERDLYLKLLKLAATESEDSFIVETLKLVTDSCSARRGYLEVQFGGVDDESGLAWAESGCAVEDIENIRAAISSGIIATAREIGETVHTTSARTDPRFKDRQSVRDLAIEAVLCVPFTTDRTCGLIYVQGSETGTLFGEAQKRRVEFVVSSMAASLERLALQRRLLQATDATVDVRKRFPAPGIIGSSAALADALERAHMGARFCSSLLIRGATGTGKSLLAKAIAAHSDRADEPFIEVNCSELVDTLADSQLFGAARGAHSTAHRDIQGLIQAASGGYLFLDEIDTLSRPVQAKLLRFLHDRTFAPLGDPHRRTIDVRVIAATNTDLRSRIAEGEFRDDLYYRVARLEIIIPSLAERRQDIPALAVHFCRKYASRAGRPGLALSTSSIILLQETEWPGNIRELDSVVERAVFFALSDGSRLVLPRHLEGRRADRVADAVGSEQTLFEATTAFKRRFAKLRLAELGGNKTKCAESLDIARSTLYELLDGGNDDDDAQPGG